MKKILYLSLLLTLICALKPSQAGVNDWHINNIGQVREIVFVKNKIYFTSYLNSIGIIDKYTGAIDVRVSAAQSQKLVNWQPLSMSLVTRYNQLITYSSKPTGGIGRNVNDEFMELPKQQKIISISQAGSKYTLTSSTLFVGSQQIRKNVQGEQFLAVKGGKTQEGNPIAYLVSVNKQQRICIDSYNGIQKLSNVCLENVYNTSQSFKFQTGKGFLVIQTKSGSQILGQDLKVKYSTQSKFVEIVDQVITFYDHSYDSQEKIKVTRRPIKSNRPQFDIYLSETASGQAILKDQTVLFELPGLKTKVFRAWINYKSQIDFQIVVQYFDLELVAYSVSSNQISIFWKRQQSLAYIKDLIFMKYFELDTLDNQYHRNIISHTYRSGSFSDRLASLPRDITLRLTQEINDLLRNIHDFKQYVIDHLTSINSNSIRKFTMSNQQEIKYGLKKYFIALTESNTILAVDTKTKQVLWKIVRQNRQEIIGLIQLKKDYQTQIAVIVSYSRQTSSIYIEQITENGAINQLTVIASSASPVFYQLNQHSLLFKIGQKVQKYSLIQNDDTTQKQYYFYTSSPEQISGWKVVDQSVMKIWSFEVTGKQKILKVTSAFRGDQRSHIPLFDQEKVFYKNVDFTNIAFITSLNHTNLALYIINGRTGKVQYNSYKNNVNMGLPYSLVYDQHNVLVSYFNARNKMFQIWTVQQYQQTIESSAINMIADYLSSNQYKPLQNREHTIFTDQVFGSTVTIKDLFVSESKMSLTRRNLFIITRQNKLYTINRDLVSSRRPKKNAKDFFSSQKLPQYAYLLPFNPTDYLSYNLPLENIKTIKFGPTDMQSSIFAVCYGTDVFLIRTAPDKTFDMITDDFNHIILLIILAAGTVVIVFFRRMLLKAKLKKPHLE